MIKLVRKEDCCGCSACVQACPKGCISMRSDNEGFLYPTINEKDCIDCGLCDRVCPVINQNESHKPLVTYAAMNADDEVRQKSSSGGVYTLLAEYVIAQGGVVFGVRFDKEWNPIFDYTETNEGLSLFRGSKYVQAVVGTAYKDAERFLKSGRKVLLVGTPCQISGLKKYLRRDYENLLTVDFICHGVPSPAVWQLFLKKTIKKEAASFCKDCKGCMMKSSLNIEIENVAFRDKRLGWRRSVLLLLLLRCSKSAEPERKRELCQENDESVFMRWFLQDLILRPSCYECPTREGKSASDITMADLWGAEHVLEKKDDNRGVSLLMINSEKGKKVWSQIGCKQEPIDFEKAIAYNESWSESPIVQPQRKWFFRTYKYLWSRYEDFGEEKQPSYLCRKYKQIKNRIKKLVR